MKNRIKENIKDLYLYFNGPKIHNPEIQTSKFSVIFVCLGNICRSPFAEHIAGKIALKQSLKDITFSSAGLEVPVSLSSPLEVLTVAERFGINLHEHKSRRINGNIAESYEMIVGMETWHVTRLREMFPDQQQKIYLLPLFEKNIKRRSWSYYRYNIADPYGKPLTTFYDCFQRIERCIEELLSQVQQSNDRLNPESSHSF